MREAFAELSALTAVVCLTVWRCSRGGVSGTGVPAVQPAVSGPGAHQEQATQRPSLRSHHPGAHTLTHTHTHTHTHTLTLAVCISTCRLYRLICVTFVQECEASPHCRRLQLKDLLVSEMQRLTKYPLLLDNIIKHTEGEERRRWRERETSCQKESNF